MREWPVICLPCELTHTHICSILIWFEEIQIRNNILLLTFHRGHVNGGKNWTIMRVKLC
jgi:hypothetical protein